MRIGYCCSVAVLLLAVANACFCKRERPEDGSADNAAAKKLHATAAPVDYRNVYRNITAAIRQLESDADTAGKRRIVQAAWDSIAGGFYCPGKAVINNTLPEAARKQSAVKAATLTAQRWALLFRVWREGDFRNRNEQISGQIAYASTVFDTLVGDTLHQMLLIPLGSIIGE